MNKHLKHLYETMSWQSLPALRDWTLEQACTVQQIPAPTFAEAQRAYWMAEQFRLLGLQNIEIDAQWNVYGVRRGQSSQNPALLLMAHTDTVFPIETDLTLKHHGERISGVGLGDNCMGLAALLAVAKWFGDDSTPFACDVWFVATSCEEGLGDLKGARAAFERLAGRIGMVINLEGLAIGHVFNGGIAVQRLHITAHTDGGHSWVHFGRPSAIHGILRLGAQITQITPPTHPRTTYNVGMIEGGQSINSIAAQAGLWLDLRSETQDELERLRRKVDHLMEVQTYIGLQFQTEEVGNRPAGRLDEGHPLVQAALDSLRLVGITPELESGSTDGNIPLSLGIPTVTIGITQGGNAHRLDEYIETGPIQQGLQHIILLTYQALHLLNP